MTHEHSDDPTQAYCQQLEQLEMDEAMEAWFSLEFELLDEEEYWKMLRYLPE